MRAAIRMRCDERGVGAASGHCHPESVEHELALKVAAHRPADHPTAEDVLDAGGGREALPGLDVLEVAD